MEQGVPLEAFERMIYQHDGAPPHTAGEVVNILNDMFPNRWIGRNGPVEWPARSPDLTPLDFFLWGYVKDRVYRTPNILSRAQTWERIQQVFGELRAHPQIVQNATDDIPRRMNFVIRANGQNIEQYPRNHNFDRIY